MSDTGLLAFYAKNLNSVEINSSFYAPPTAAMLKNWQERTGEGFRFAFKAPRLVTHILKLGKGSSEAALNFSRRLAGLGGKRGPVLFQLPPYHRCDTPLLRSFLSSTTEIEDRVFEFATNRGFRTKSTASLRSRVQDSASPREIRFQP